MRGQLHIPFPAMLPDRLLVTRFFTAVRLLILMLGLAGLAGCSSRTTVSEWSCPTDQPEGCFSVAEGDARAIAALKGANSSAASGDPAIGTKRTVVRRMTLPVPISSGGAETQWFDAEGWPLRPEAGQTGASSSGLPTKNPSSGPSLATAGAGEAGRDTGRDIGRDARQAGTGREPIDLTVFAGGSQVGADGTTYHAPSGESLRTPSSGDMTASGGLASGGTILTRAAPVTPAPALVRIPERLAEIWIGPFEDAEGNFHPAGRLFIVITPARWAPAGTTISPAYGHEDIYSREGIYDREDRR